MNLLFYVPQMAAYGGIERHVCSLASAAARRGHTVRMLTTSNSLGDDLRRDLDHPSITLRELPRARGSANVLLKTWWLFRELRHCAHQPWDVIYTNGQSALARFVWSAATSDRSRATRIVHHHHNAADAGEQATWSKSFRRVLRTAPELVGCSRATCNAINAAVGRDDARFLPYITRDPLVTDRVEDRDPGAPLRFGFCGRLIPEKGIDHILALAADDSLSDVEWHIHGAGPAYPPERFEGNPRLRYHGAYHSAQEHADALLKLDALSLFSTHNEGMPLSLIEAMSAGLPWIATDRGGTRELAASPEDSLVAPAESGLPDLREHVRSLATRIRKRTTSRRRQRGVYDARFAPPVTAGLWLDYFEGARSGE